MLTDVLRTQQRELELRLTEPYVERARANRKVYCIDNGFVTAKGFQFSPNVGKLCENLVAVALKRLELAGLAEVYFWKSPQQEEVDFVVKQGAGVTQLIQICWSLQAPRTKTREVRALLKASRELGCHDLLVLTESAEAEETAEWFGIKERVRYVPLRKWLLECTA